MIRSNHNLGTAQRRTTRKLARACGPLFEAMEPRQLMSTTLYVDGRVADVTIDVNASGGIETIVQGVKTDYSAGDWDDVSVTSGFGRTVNMKASVVPVSIYTESGKVNFHNSHGVRDIKALVSVDTPLSYDPLATVCHIVLDDTGDSTARTIQFDKINGADVIGGMAPANIFIKEHIPTGYLAGGDFKIISGSGADTINITSVDAKDVIITDSAGGADTVNVGGNGSQYIAGTVSVTNTPSLTHLVIDYAQYNSSTDLVLDGYGGLDYITNEAQYPASAASIDYKVSDVADVTIKAGQDVTTLVKRTDVPTSIIGMTAASDNKVAVGVWPGDFGNGSMANIIAPLSISNPTGYTQLILNDIDDANARLAQINAQAVTGLSPATISFVGADIRSLEINLPQVGGNGAIVRGTGMPTFLNSFADNADPADTVTISNGGSVQGIVGALTVKTSAHANVTIDDSADPTARNATLSVALLGQFNSDPYTKITGLAPGAINVDLMAAPLNIKGGSGGNTFNVLDTPWQDYFNNTLLASTTNLNTGTGADTVNVKGTGNHTVLNIEGQSGLDTVQIGNGGNAQSVSGTVNVANTGQLTTLIVNDSLDPVAQSITLDATAPLAGSIHPRGTITGIAPGTINYIANDMNAVSIRGGIGGNTVIVNNTPAKTVGLSGGNTINLMSGFGVDHVTIKAVNAGTTLNLDGVSGTDPVTIGSNGSVQNIFGTVNVSNTAQFEALTIDDSADPLNRVVTIDVLGAVPGNTVGSITGLAPGIINFTAADVANPTILGGSGANTYNIVGTPTTQANGFYGPTITLFAGTGADVINVTGIGNGTGLKVYGQANDDVVSVDYSGGGIPLNHTITFDGGSAGQFGDVLSIKGTAATNFTATAGSVNRGANGHVDYSAVNTLYFNTGTFNVNNNLNIPALAAQTAATNVLFNTSQTIGKLYVDGAQTSLASGGGKLLAVQSLNIVNNGLLDLADNSMLLDYTGASQLPAIQNLIKTARAGGTWTGGGLTSTSAKNANPKNTTLAAIEAVDYKSIYGANAMFAGQPLDNSAVLVKYTYYGDTDFNGKVDFDDYSRTDAGFNQGKSGWTNGDFDNNGHVDFDDYALIDQAFNSQTTVFARPTAGAGRVDRGAMALR